MLIKNRNKGDSAIWAGQNVLLEALNIKTCYVLAQNVRDFNATVLREKLVEHGGPSKTAILFVGGGNFGDLWYRVQQQRESVAEKFPDYRIRSFPQTYKYNDAQKLKHTQEVYGKHPDLQLTVRDTRSYMDLQRDFGAKHKILLLPDAATMLIGSPPDRPAKKSGLDYMFLARTDKEGAQNHWEEKKTIDELQHSINEEGKEITTKIEITDWIDKDPVGLDKVDDDGKALLRVEWAWDFLNQGALILSDRLHVHILSTLWGIDHVVIEEGKYAKLKTYHDTWLLKCENRVAMSQSVREGVDAAKAWYHRGGSFT